MIDRLMNAFSVAYCSRNPTVRDNAVVQAVSFSSRARSGVFFATLGCGAPLAPVSGFCF